jgi:hypothetical protein
MKITIECNNDEVRQLLPNGWQRDTRLNLVLAGKERAFFPESIEHLGSTFGESVSRLYLEEIVEIKTKQQIKAEEAVKAAEESLKKAKEALEAIRK